MLIGGDDLLSLTLQKESSSHRFHIPHHPSESAEYFVLKFLMLSFHFHPEVEFSTVCQGQTPTLYFENSDGPTWLDIGPVGLKKQRKARAKGASLYLYTFKSPELTLGKLDTKISKLKVFFIPPRDFKAFFEFLLNQKKMTIKQQDHTVLINNYSFSRELLYPKEN